MHSHMNVNSPKWCFLRALLLNTVSPFYQDFSDRWTQQISGNLIVKINLLLKMTLLDQFHGHHHHGYQHVPEDVITKA